MNLLAELKRRNVFRVAAAYVVTSWLLIQVAATLFPLFGFDAAPARIVVLVLAIGFVPATTFAWAFELTPEGLKKESDVDRSRSITPQTGKKLDRIIMLVLALALGYFAIDKFVIVPTREAALKEAHIAAVERARIEGRAEALVESYGEQSIAVLAFDDMSQDGDQEYLSDGIAEELLNLLVQIPDLRVISRSSAFSYKGKDMKLSQIANELKVAHILEGSVRKAGSQVRITAQLIDARSDTHLWSETYDRELDDIFAIQDEIAAAVVKQLEIRLLGAALKVRETDPQAYALYLQARYLDDLGSVESYKNARDLYEQVLTIDPDYPSAWTSLAMNYMNMAQSGLLSWDEAYAQARALTEKALAIDPDFAGAERVFGWIEMVYNNDLARAAQHMNRALTLEPTGFPAISNAAVLLFRLGRFEEAIEVYQYLVAHDPVDPDHYFNLGYGHFIAHHWDDVIASFETVLRLSPESIGAHYLIGAAHLFKGEPEIAQEFFALENGEIYQLKGKTAAHFAMGLQEEFQAGLNELIERWGNQYPAEVAHVYAWVGDVDRAFQWLGQSAQKGKGAFIPSDPFLDSLATDPRWPPLLESIGESPEQLDAIEFEVTLPLK